MEPVFILITSFTIGLTGALMPGPLLTFTISETMARGFMAGPFIVLGHALLEIVLIVALFLGLQEFFVSDTVRGIIGVLGGLVLLGMGISIMAEVLKKRLQLIFKGQAPQQGFWKNPVVGGVLISISNPYFILWWVTIGSTYILFSQNYGLMGILFFFLGHFLADFSWYCLVSFAVSKGRKYFSANIYRGVLTGCALFLIIIALYFVLDGWRNLEFFWS